MSDYTLPPLPTCSLVIVLEGRAHCGADAGEDGLGDEEIARGHVLYVPADMGISLTIVEAPLHAYRAFTPVEAVASL